MAMDEEGYAMLEPEDLADEATLGERLEASMLGQSLRLRPQALA